jgi:hypothetical protein
VEKFQKKVRKEKVKKYEDIEKIKNKTNIDLLKELMLYRNLQEGTLTPKNAGKVKIIDRKGGVASYVMGIYDKSEISEAEAEEMIIKGTEGDSFNLVMLDEKSPLLQIIK